MILTPTKQGALWKQSKRTILNDQGFESNDFTIKHGAHHDIPDVLSARDAGAGQGR